MNEIVIIGSLSCIEQVRSLAAEYKSNGEKVWYPQMLGAVSFTRTAEEIFAKINTARKIIIIKESDGSLSERASYAIAYARCIGKGPYFSIIDAKPMSKEDGILSVTELNEKSKNELIEYAKIYHVQLPERHVSKITRDEIIQCIFSAGKAY